MVVSVVWVLCMRVACALGMLVRCVCVGTAGVVIAVVWVLCMRVACALGMLVRCVCVYGMCGYSSCQVSAIT